MWATFAHWNGDTAASTLLQWETIHFSEDPVGHGTVVLVHKSESGAVRFVQTACKALSKHGSEQSGVYQPFTAYLSSNNLPKNALASFKGNILFYDAGVVYHISPLIEKFFTEVQSPNQLLKLYYQMSKCRVPSWLQSTWTCKQNGYRSLVACPGISEYFNIRHERKVLSFKICLEQWSQDAVLC